MIDHWKRFSRSVRLRGVGGTLKRVIAHPLYIYSEWSFDRRYGVDTAEQVPVSALGLGNGHAGLASRYEPVNPAVLRGVLRSLKLDYPAHTFIDLGSGKGRVLLIAAEFPFARVIGVELSQSLHEIAAANLARRGGKPLRCRDISPIFGDAAAFQFPQDPILLFLFNPFPGEVMNKVLANLEKSWKQAPRAIHVIYANPVCRKEFENTAFLKPVRELGHLCIYKAA